MQCPFCKQDVESPDGRCPKCKTALAAAPANHLNLTQAQPVMTREPNVPITSERTIVQRRESQQQQTPLKFRPCLRPPMLVLCAWDDDGQHGNWTRIYAKRFVIGRSEGDLLFPHDLSVSTKHLEIVREAADGRWVWKLRDLESANGTFVRIDRSTLHDGQILLIGSGRYQFKGIAQGGRQVQMQADIKKTQNHPTVTREDITPTLVRLNSESDAETGEDRKLFIESNEQWVGSDEAICRSLIVGDPFIDAQHAKICSTGRDQWTIQDNDSTNGTWSMIQEVVIDESIQFQIGEQRFLARVP